MHKSKSHWFMVFALCVGVLFAWTVGPSQVSAQAGHIDGVRIDGHMGLGWHGFGPGLRLDIALVPDGFIPSLDDEFALTFGADLLFGSRYHGHRHRHYYDDQHYYNDGHNDPMFLFPVAVQWNFILPHNWTIFPELGLALVHHSHLDVTVHAAFGGRWHFGGGKIALLLRLAHPGAFQIGITW